MNIYTWQNRLKIYICHALGSIHACHTGRSIEVGDEAQDFSSDCRCDIFSDLYGTRVGDMEDRGVKRNPEIYVAV